MRSSTGRAALEKAGMVGGSNPPASNVNGIFLRLEVNVTNNEVAAKLKDALETLRKNKPKDRSEMDRVYAVCITEMEKLLAYFEYNANGDKSKV